MAVKKRVTLKFKLIILFACLIYAGILFVDQTSLLSELNREKTELTKQHEQQSMLNAQLQNQAQFTGSDAYIEKAAREKLGWVKENEIKFVEENK